MNIFLWVVQMMLAFAFLAHGLLFLFPPEAVRGIKKQLPFPAGFMRFIYVAEILAALGLTLPGLTGTLPPLTRWRRPGWRSSWEVRRSFTCHARRQRRQSSPPSSSRSRSSWPARAGS